MMAFDVRVPELGESVTEGVLVRWAYDDGAVVDADAVLLELETDKASVEIPTERAGVLRIRVQAGATVQVGDVVAVIEEASGEQVAITPEPAPVTTSDLPAVADAPLSPAVRRLVTEHDVDPAAVAATGPRGRLTKGDVLAHVERAAPAPAPVADPAPPKPATVAPVPAPTVTEATPREERVPMTRIRQRIAERLVAAQQTAAILTTFNEVDMSAVMSLRSRYKQRFEEVHGIRLGFMSLFAAACVAALREIPELGAQIDGTDVVYRHYVNLGVAVGTERGLVVPVVKDADRRSLAGIEREIARLAEKARTGKLSVDDLTGGTFTISNGGVYGSMMSTPILNPPQSGILGMHKIEKRPVVVDDEIVIRPMMYLALSYDHRLVDGEQAVTFLVRVKEHIEDPTRMLLDV
jgi:2-oxoglutarate dehydrogenase E2 component (dihydrolipoamide succinyltransferase)